MKLTNTKSVITDTGIKMMVYGHSGVGKTTIINKVQGERK